MSLHHTAHQEIILNKLKFYSQTLLPSNIAESSSFDTCLDHMTNHVVMTMKTMIAGTEEQLIERQWPKTWIDAIKDRWAPKWIRPHIKIQYNYIKIDKQTLFPSIKVPKHESIIRLHIVEYATQGDLK